MWKMARMRNELTRSGVALLLSICALLALLAQSCGKVREGSGETHFLRYCTDSCASGLECVCGVCTERCSDADACSQRASGAECVTSPAACGATQTSCDVACTSDAQCASISAQHRCEQGQCRTGEPLPPVTRPCPAGCSAVAGYPEDTARGCVDVGAPSEVACACGELASSSECRRRRSDASLWILPSGELAGDDWESCSSAESQRITRSCDFASCELGPPSLCSRGDTCAQIGCGGPQYDSDGCARVDCESNADCAGDLCLTASLRNTSFCSYGADGTCNCAGPPVALSGSFCNPRGSGPPLGPLCDGSSDVRLAVHQSGGFVASETVFLRPYGRFLFVAGSCEFYVGAGGDGSVRIGQLTAQEAEALSQDVSWSSLQTWSRFRDTESCPDAGFTTVQAPGAPVQCTCGCGPTAPSGLEAAISRSAGQIQLFSEKAPTGVTPSVRVVALPADSLGIPEQTLFPWPLEWNISRILLSDGALVASSGLEITDPDEVAVFRDLVVRNADAEVAARVSVADESGTAYVLLVRDELPEELRRSAEALLRQAN